MARVILYPFLFPTDLVGWALVSLIGLIGRARFSFTSGVLLAMLPRETWIGHRFAAWGGVTLGHAMLIFADQSPATLVHESTHVRQLEGAGVAAFCLGLITVDHPIQAFLIWALGPTLTYLGGTVVALCYGGNAYRDNPNEVAAYDRAR